MHDSLVIASVIIGAIVFCGAMVALGVYIEKLRIEKMMKEQELETSKKAKNRDEEIKTTNIDAVIDRIGKFVQ